MSGFWLRCSTLLEVTVA